MQPNVSKPAKFASSEGLPAQTITSFRADTVYLLPLLRNSTPIARRGLELGSKTILVTDESIMTARFFL